MTRHHDDFNGFVALCMVVSLVTVLGLYLLSLAVL